MTHLAIVLLFALLDFWFVWLPLFVIAGVRCGSAVVHGLRAEPRHDATPWRQRRLLQAACIVGVAISVVLIFSYCSDSSTAHTYGRLGRLVALAEVVFATGLSTAPLMGRGATWSTRIAAGAALAMIASGLVLLYYPTTLLLLFGASAGHHAGPGQSDRPPRGRGGFRLPVAPTLMR